MNRYNSDQFIEKSMKLIDRHKVIILYLMTTSHDRCKIFSNNNSIFQGCCR